MTVGILWQDAFDLYNNGADLALNYTTLGGNTVQIANGRFGGGCFQSVDGFHGISKNVGTQTNIWMSIALNLYSASVGDLVVMQWMSDGVTASGVEATLTYNATSGVWKLWRGYLSGGSSTLLNSTSAPIAQNAWHWIDARFKYSDTVGEFELWIDDSQKVTLTGLDVVVNAGANLVAMVLGDMFSSNSQNMDFDDFFIYDTGTARLGDTRIETLLPASDATPNNGTPSTGTNHYACVNEAQWATGTFITMPNVSGDKEVYGFGPLTSSPSNIWNVKAYTVSRKSDAGSFLLSPLVVSGGTEADATGQQLLTTNGTQEGMWALNPHTSTAWTTTTVNALDAGYKVP